MLGSDRGVREWGDFVYLSAGRELRERMDEVAEEQFAGDPF